MALVDTITTRPFKGTLATIDIRIYMYMYTHTYIHTYIHAYVVGHDDESVEVHVGDMKVNIHLLIHTHTCTYIFFYMHIFIHSFAYI